MLNWLDVFKLTLTVLLLLVVLVSRFLLFSGSRGGLASLHDIVNNLRVGNENIAGVQGGIRPSNGLFGGHTKFYTLVPGLIFHDVILA